MMRLFPALTLLAASAAMAQTPLRVLVVTGGHDHPPSFYSVVDDPRFNVNVDPHPMAFRGDMTKRHDVLVLYDMIRHLDDEKKRANLKAFAEAGKGIVVLHHALCSHTDWPWWSENVAGAKYRYAPDDKVDSKYLHDVNIDVTVVKKHPVTAGIDNFTIFDETYKDMWFSPGIDVLLKTNHATADGPLAWIGTHPKARVVSIQLGHGREAHVHPSFQRLVRNAIQWVGGR